MLRAVQSRLRNDLRFHQRQFQVKLIRLRDRWRRRCPAPACFACGYHLKHSPNAARCPECGRAIDWSPTIWTDGRYPLRRLLVLAATPLPTILALIYLLRHLHAMAELRTGTNAEIIALLSVLTALLPIMFLPPVLAPWLAQQRVRTFRSMIRRQALCAAVSLVACSLGVAAVSLAMPSLL